MTEVSDPFYLGHLENPDEVYLFRCLESGQSCAVDGLPGPGVASAGADARHVVVRLRNGSFIWFRRIPQEKLGWGLNPEVMVGPIDEAAFRRAQRLHALPDPSITP